VDVCGAAGAPLAVAVEAAGAAGPLPEAGAVEAAGGAAGAGAAGAGAAALGAGSGFEGGGSGGAFFLQPTASARTAAKRTREERFISP
jgi:hypothetical protein